jgi:hypothetical protein
MKDGRGNGNAVRWLGAALLLVAACKATTAESARASVASESSHTDASQHPATDSATAASPEILQVRTFWANMYLIRSDKLITFPC